jgi:hypothetical protein
MPVARNVRQPIKVFIPAPGRASPDHEIHPRLGDATFDELLCFSPHGPEKGSALLVSMRNPGPPVLPETVARSFIRARLSDVTPILETLTALGQAKKDEGRYWG